MVPEGKERLKNKKTIIEGEQINHERRKYSCPTNTEKIFNLTSDQESAAILRYQLGTINLKPVTDLAKVQISGSC